MSASGRRPWREQRTDDGSWTLLHPEHGEGCHSLAGAWSQARERYASVLADLPPATVATGRVRLLDIGTGLGMNLAAALEACEARGLALDAASLEIDVSVLHAALELFRREPVCSPAHRRVLDALALRLAAGEAGRAELACALPGAGAHRLEFVQGDARATLGLLDPDRRFDAVFLDPFSPRIDPPSWDEAFLSELARRMDAGARLSTYTVAFKVRIALARAGLAVGSGPRVGRKAAGTVAAQGGAVSPLDARTRRRLDRALALKLASDAPPASGSKK